MTTARDDPALQLDRESVRALLAAHRQLNHTHFRGQLRAPQIALGDAESYLGRWRHDARTIELSRKLVREQRWGVVLEVLKHEMAHQFVDEILQVNEPPHGPAFRGVCKRLGIDERAQGLPELARDPAAERMLATVHKLLALAESDNQHEAEAAAVAAQRLMLRHNLALPDARAGAGPSYGFRQLGRVTGRVTEWERRLGNLLRDHFFVDVIWVPAFDVASGKRGSVMEAIGTPENLDLAAYVYEFLARTAERLWPAYKRDANIRGNADRRTFLAGVMHGFAEKLDAQARVHRREGLVWVPHADLVRYTKQRHPYLRSIAHRSHGPRDAFHEGQKAGRNVVLHKGVSASSGGGERKLLRG
ncbi:MAG: DUF2786 domain-containing protein [Polyangiales bacterium]